MSTAITKPGARFTVRLADPGQPARIYNADAITEADAKRELRTLARGVLPGGTAQLYAGPVKDLRGDEDPIFAIEVQ